MEITTTSIVLETKMKIEKMKKLFPDNIPKLKKNFINATGMGEKEWNIIYNFPPINNNQEFNSLLKSLIN
ncbi:MAG: hypothetical protein M0Q88_02850 [Bacilli bacterium]|nr:hypothetical protein [Bacilli bacterium]